MIKINWCDHTRLAQFARAGDAARRTQLPIFRQQVFDAIEDVQGDALCGGRILFGDMGAQGQKIVNVVS